MSTLFVAILTIVTMLLGAMFVSGAFKPVANNTVKADANDEIFYFIYEDNEGELLLNGPATYNLRHDHSQGSIDVKIGDEWFDLYSMACEAYEEAGRDTSDLNDWISDDGMMYNIEIIWGEDGSGNKTWENNQGTIKFYRKDLIERTFDDSEYVPWTKYGYQCQVVDFNGCNPGKIGSYVFYNTYSATIYIPSSVSTIENYAFSMSDTLNLYIPKSVTEIGTMDDISNLNIYYAGTAAEWFDLVNDETGVEWYDGENESCAYLYDKDSNLILADPEPPTPEPEEPQEEPVDPNAGSGSGSGDNGGNGSSNGGDSGDNGGGAPSTGIEVNIGVAIASLVLVGTLFVVASRKRKEDR